MLTHTMEIGQFALRPPLLGKVTGISESAER